MFIIVCFVISHHHIQYAMKQPCNSFDKVENNRLVKTKHDQ